ncbi:DUF4166 domain-containing protein [Aliamphritea ceti]|uniref:DUF4166 domain-containing protein n=1 Tax=Aliamphritea ceti TaxID=1524258 RepID=UPI0021C38CF1|nr:DUF4166 domain-containing protein [Aliamphritea ceti]
MNTDNKQPVFSSIFAPHWHELPTVMHKHYLNRPYTDDHTQVTGTINVWCAWPLKRCARIFWWLKSIPPHCETNVPITVDFHSSPYNNHFRFERTFKFKNRACYRFTSAMEPIKDNLVIERMSRHIGWLLSYTWENQKIKLNHQGYMVCLGKIRISLPITWLIGKGHAEEWALDDNRFAMRMYITHPWWGKLYQYDGEFTINKLPDTT